MAYNSDPIFATLPLTKAQYKYAITLLTQCQRHPKDQKKLKEVFNNLESYNLNAFKGINYEYRDGQFDINHPRMSTHDSDRTLFFYFIQHLVKKFHLSPVEVNWSFTKDQSPAYVKIYNYGVLVKANEIEVLEATECP